ncbi:HNH endonuclease signature motif containing protein [Microbacterium sp. SORGH_AS_0888]|uniref:HNH endonuclease signature motif containing protein n=1 Tax=Microbacterium sp. SORGH_AS_0888 TaxID=3041791 RepID=UPI00277E686E|nr:HNH endonuclease signature motif containing protein [Microbacterium sp. SORGH_AS_0888]MDQ1130116.1 hypothetical protein [Microbacterium sp. SORGH_AS_0888]
MARSAGVGFTDGQWAELASLVRELESAQAVICAGEAARARALARAGDLVDRLTAGEPVAVVAQDIALRGVAAEVAGVLRVTDRWAQRQVVEAGDLVASYPDVVAAWEAGRITRGHVAVITELGAPLPAAARLVFAEAAVGVCEAETPNRARGRLAVVAERLHPRSFAERHAQARETRCVRVADVGEGMAELIATLPSLLAHAVYDRLTAQGRAVDDARTRARARRAQRSDERAGQHGGEASGGGAGDGSPNGFYESLVPTDVVASDERGMDQIRADILTDMLLTGDPYADPTREGDGPGVLGAIRARVQVTVPALTALATDDGPADLTGHAPIDPVTARRLLGTTAHPLERLLTHPVTGSVVEVDTYQRPASLDRFLRARDQHCRFPGCRLAAIRCELDHTRDWAKGGKTHRGNLAHLCQRHHSMKQFTPWHVTQHEGGTLHWTSPSGRVYTDVPAPPVTFIPDDQEAPPGASRTATGRDGPPPF